MTLEPFVEGLWFVFHFSLIFAPEHRTYLPECRQSTNKDAPPDYLSRSHGEGFLRFFGERCANPGLFLFDEPESALSPNREFEFLKVLHRLNREATTQVILATHSPILMSLPGARQLQIDGGRIEPVALEDTDHFQLLRAFTADWRGTVDGMLEG